MYIKLKEDVSFIGGHLFTNISYGTKYIVQNESSFGYKITDDFGVQLLVSNTAFRKYFKRC